MELKYSELLNQALNMQGSMGTTYSRFYNYSITNQFFFMMQGINEPVANFNTWRKLGRFPKKNTGKFVITPVPLYGEKDGEKEQTGVFFKLKKGVFAYSDTFGDELEVPPVTAIDWTIERAESALNITRVPFTSMNANSQGYSQHMTYALNPVAVYPLKTTMHELAHIVLGHTDTKGLEEYQDHRGIMEFQAEAVAYILMNEFESENWNKEESRAYIQNWLKGPKAPEGWQAENTVPTDKEIKAVFTATNKILKAGMPKEDK